MERRSVTSGAGHNIPTHPTSEAGFSLIEVMVTLMIVGLASAIVVMTAPPGTQSLDKEADRLATRLAAARDLALIQNRTVLIDLTDEGYAQRIRTFDGWTTPANNPPLSPWDAGTSISHPTGRLPAAITFDAIGLTEPTTLTLIRDGRTATIEIDAAGQVTRDGAP